MLIGEIIAELESFAPPAYQESWDNTGLQVGSRAVECTGVLICVDVTPAVVDEAISRSCNLIVSHHPLMFKGLKRITGATPVEISVINAIAAGVSIYSCHTAVDNAPGGVSYTMARMLGVDVRRVLAPIEPRWCKLSVMVPQAEAESVRMAMFDAGAGTIGNYDCCSYNVSGTGTFRAKPGAHPFVGDIDELHHEPEVRIDVLVPNWLRSKVESAMLEVHPYEEPAYEFINIANTNSKVGSGIVGTLAERLTPRQLIEKVKATFGSPVVRCTHFDADDTDMLISRVALCGGAGGSFINDAITAGAQAYINSDTRYHDFVDYQNKILIIDIGHFESEQCTKDIFYQIITQKFTNFAVYKSQLEINPINYI
jgi:dinuclear metal center YbgI/SA1388 family protein